jgi:hypothetical protein
MLPPCVSLYDINIHVTEMSRYMLVHKLSIEISCIGIPEELAHSKFCIYLSKKGKLGPQLYIDMHLFYQVWRLKEEQDESSRDLLSPDFH